jgi:hypothetical protein
MKLAKTEQRTIVSVAFPDAKLVRQLKLLASVENVSIAGREGRRSAAVVHLWSWPLASRFRCS